MTKRSRARPISIQLSDVDQSLPLLLQLAPPAAGSRPPASNGRLSPRYIVISLIIRQRTLFSGQLSVRETLILFQRCTLVRRHLLLPFCRSSSVRVRLHPFPVAARLLLLVYRPSSTVYRHPSVYHLLQSVIRPFCRSTDIDSEVRTPTRSSKFLISRVASCASCCRLLV